MESRGLTIAIAVLVITTASWAGSLNMVCRTFDEQNAPVIQKRDFTPGATAIVIVDMWDAHWCRTHTQRVGELAAKMNPVLDAARQLGVQVVFSPSDVVGYYKDDPRRQAVLKIARYEKPALEAFDPPLPPWAKTGGCECGPDRPCKGRNDAWARQNAALVIKDGDLIVNGNDNQELYNVCREKGITTLLYMGTAANMCISFTRSVAMRQMRQLGFDCVLVRDMALAISGQGYDPDKKQKLAWFCPLYADELVFQHLDRYFGASALSVDILTAAGQAKPVFTVEQVQAYKPKGPTQCFRHLCYDYNWTGRAMEDLPKKFSQADPVAMAQFSERCNLDAALLLAVPHHGYCTYETRVGKKFPAMKGDWYGRVIEEHHKRGISVLGYITLGTNWKFMRDNYDQSFIHSKVADNGLVVNYNGLCLNTPGYLELVEAYTREVLRHYPVDGIRYDMLFSPKGCLCAGCRALYRELYGEELAGWDKVDWRRREEFYLETLRRPSRRLIKIRNAIKPSVEIWQNHVNLHSECDVNVGRLQDIAYIEFGAPGQLLILNGILDKQGIIIGQTLKSPIRRQIMALGARCYQYAHKSEMDQRTVLPWENKRDWFYNDLGPFFAMVREVQPYLEGARPFSHVAGLYSEKTRYRYEGFNRKAYLKVCDSLTLACLKASLPLQWLNVLDLGEKDLRQYRALVLPETSGLTAAQLDRLRGYVVGGGQLLVVGGALSHDKEGRQRKDFALADVMGLTWQKKKLSRTAAKWTWRNGRFDGGKAFITAENRGKCVVSMWSREPGAAIDKIYLTQDKEFLASDETVAALWEGVRWEAEDWLAESGRGGGQWKKRTKLPDYTGHGYIVCDGGGVVKDTDQVAQEAAEVKYEVFLPEAGTWYVWIRQQSPDSGHDSVHVGLSGEVMASVDFDVENRQSHPADRSPRQWQVVVDQWEGDKGPAATAFKTVTKTQAEQGDTLLTLECDEGRAPLLHVNDVGVGRVAYLASADSPEFTLEVLRWLAEGMPVVTEPADKQAVLTRQEKRGRWVLHLLSDGDYRVRLADKYISVKEVVKQYPAKGWSCETRKTREGLEFKISGRAKDRLLILK